MDPERHTDVGAYVLGVIDADDAQRFEAHLQTCASCRTEVASLSGTAELLRTHKDELLEAEADFAEPPPVDPPSQRAGHERRRRRSFALAAAVALISAGGGAGLGATVFGDDTSQSPPVATAPDTATTLTATDPDTGVEGEVTVEQATWGSKIALQLANVQGPLTCELIAVTKSGDEQVAMSWTIPGSGYADAGKLPTFGGGVASAPDVIDRFVVRTDDDRTLVTIPA